MVFTSSKPIWTSQSLHKGSANSLARSQQCWGEGEVQAASQSRYTKLKINPRGKTLPDLISESQVLARQGGQVKKQPLLSTELCDRGHKEALLLPSALQGRWVSWARQRGERNPREGKGVPSLPQPSGSLGIWGTPALKLKIASLVLILPNRWHSGITALQSTPVFEKQIISFTVEINTLIIMPLSPGRKALC